MAVSAKPKRVTRSHQTDVAVVSSGTERTRHQRFWYGYIELFVRHMLAAECKTRGAELHLI